MRSILEIAEALSSLVQPSHDAAAALKRLGIAVDGLNASGDKATAGREAFEVAP